ncbi:hypothetical protein [Scytonema sp. PRP1]|uniref:hypothetical protein n=1 Tax=Scytonema sp. PRP1 TaxID=3120513 RepID=UPI002FD52A38
MALSLSACSLRSLLYTQPMPQILQVLARTTLWAATFHDSPFSNAGAIVPIGRRKVPLVTAGASRRKFQLFLRSNELTPSIQN